jgi:hypothetical protein
MSIYFETRRTFPFQRPSRESNRIAMSSTIQVLVFPTNSTFNQPGTLAGRQWKTALGYLASCPSFSSAWWGRHLEAPELVTVLVDWNTSSAAKAFLSKHYASFAAFLEPLLAMPAHLPDAAEINPISLAEPAALPGGGGLTTISKLTYDSLSADQRFHLLAPTFEIYVQELGAAADHGAAGFKGGNAAWAVDSTGEKTTTLWLLTSWQSVEAEQRCEKTFQTANGLNMKDTFLRKMLEQADPGVETHHVAWEILTPDIMEWWKDSDNTTWPYQPLKNSEDIST